MKKSLLLLLIAISTFAFAQSPQSFKYQAVVRDAGGVLSVNTVVSIKTSILAGSATGTSVYSEKQTLSTNDYGVVSLNIGSGTVLSGSFSTISWGTTTYFVKTELDINGGSTYVFMGTSQILSVPYALYAEKTGSSLSDHDTSATNEIQTISITTNTLTLSKSGGSVNLTPYLDNTDSQTLSLVGNSLQISGGNAVNITGAVDLDADPTNELQTLSVTTNTISISNGNSITLNDNDATNELQTLTLNLGSLKISSRNTVNLPDSSATNELQTLSITQGSLKISSKNTIHLPDSSATNEIQTLTVTSDSIKLSKGGGAIKIPTPTNAVVPQNNCINSTSLTPPSGYSFSGNNYITRNEKWVILKDTSLAQYYNWSQCSVNNKIYCIGGQDGGTYYKNNYEYNPSTNTIIKKADMPTARFGCLIGYANNKIYAIGSAANSKENEEYNPATNVWTIKSNAPSNLSNVASIISYNNKIYIFGGEGGSVYASVFVYDPSIDNWSTYSLPTGRKNIKTILYNNLIYLIGGRDATNDVGTVETFNPTNNTTTTVATLNTIIGSTIDAFLLNNKLYVLGTNIIEEYNSTVNKWNVLSDFTNWGNPSTVNRSFSILNNTNQVFYIGDFGNLPVLLDFDNMVFTKLKSQSSINSNNLENLSIINNKYYFTSTGNNGGSHGIVFVEFKLPSVYYIHCAN